MQVKIWGKRILSVHLNGQSDYQMCFLGLVEESCLGISLQLLLHVSSTPSRVKREVLVLDIFMSLDLRRMTRMSPALWTDIIICKQYNGVEGFAI